MLASDALNSTFDALWSTADISPIVEPLSDTPEAEPLMGTGSPSGFTPTQLRHAYGFDQVFFDGGSIQGDGTGQTIAIVNAYHTPTAAADLASFSTYFGLPNVPSFTQVDQNGGISYPTTNANWALETLLDIQWAHAFAPGASILLVETYSASFSDLVDGVDFARNYPGVSAISMSWGVDEFPSETFYDQYFTTPVGHAGVTFFGAAGNTGGPGKYPAYSANVTAVGGTSLTLNGSNNIVAETAWSGSGGGISQYQAKPSWQNGVANQSATNRVMPDVAFNANPNTGVPVYDTFNNSPAAPWTKVGGTSFATPAWAALVTVANQGRALAGLPVFNTSTLMTKLYSMPASNFNDITSGTSTGTIPQSAGVGFDAITGRGTPKAALIVDSLVGFSVPPTTVSLTAATDTGVSNSDGITLRNNANGGSTLQFQVNGTVAGATVSVYADGVLIGSAVAGGPVTVVTTGGTLALADGEREITARQTTSGNPQSSDSAPLAITIDTTPPTASFVAVTPDPRANPVGSIDLQFSEYVSGLSLAALSLTRDAGSNLLTGAQTVTTGNNITWTLNNLTSITTASGIYELLLTSSLSPVIDLAGNLAGNAVEMFTINASVLGRMLFYNQSKFDGNSAAINASDDLAIAPDKTPYLVGTGTASFSNISNYSRGINGIMIDLAGSHPGITGADFTFRVGSNNSLENWLQAPAPVEVSVRAGAGQDGSDRVELVWANDAIANQWLEVTILANANTGLVANDVFYFGSRLGDTGVNSPATVVLTNSADEIAVRNATGTNIPLTNTYDFDRNGLISVSDQIIARNNIGSLVRLNLTTPSAPEAIAAAVVASDDEAAASERVVASPLVSSSQLSSPASERVHRAHGNGLAFALAHEWFERGRRDVDRAFASLDVDEELLDLLLAARGRRTARS